MDALAVAHPRVRVFHNPTNIGLGASYRLGVSNARHEYVMLLCGDGGMPASSLPAIFDKIGSADIVVPYCENLKEIKTPGRYLLSRTFSTLRIPVRAHLRAHNGLAVHRVSLVSGVRAATVWLSGGSSSSCSSRLVLRRVRSTAPKANRSSAQARNILSVSRKSRLLRQTLLTKRANRPSASARAEAG
jgi:glycosyltransferase involved in cell wall biosynthesis